MDSERQVAVVTGAAGGIGRGIAEEAGRRGMTVVLLDVDNGPLDELAEAFRLRQVQVDPRKVDVSDTAAVDDLAADLFDRYGRVDYLFNNAGVLVGGLSWERSPDDWRWTFEVNVMGVVNGVRAFVPHMIKAGRPAHVVNTASIGGLRASPMLGPYCASKFAVVGLTETLQYEFDMMELPLKAALLCPGEVASGIWKSDRVRPAKFAGQGQEWDEKAKTFFDRMNANNDTGMQPDEIGRFVFQALDEGQFYLLPHPQQMARVKHRIDLLMSGGRPALI
jgi:NAD(P)-dependent dehydrogenase (short-subunit alcohol dehydrogenase family)